MSLHITMHYSVVIALVMQMLLLVLLCYHNVCLCFVTSPPKHHTKYLHDSSTCSTQTCTAQAQNKHCHWHISNAKALPQLWHEFKIQHLYLGKELPRALQVRVDIQMLHPKLLEAFNQCLLRATELCKRCTHSFERLEMASPLWWVLAPPDVC